MKNKPTKRKLETVLKSMSQSELARHIGAVPSRINQLTNRPYDIWVEYQNGVPINVQYEHIDRVIIGKEPAEGE